MGHFPLVERPLTLQITNGHSVVLCRYNSERKRTSELCVETERLEVNRFKTMGWSFRAIC